MKTLLDYIKEDVFDIDDKERLIKSQLSDILDSSNELSIKDDTLRIDNIDGLSVSVNNDQLVKLIETCELLKLKKISANEFYFDFKKDVDFKGIEIITDIDNMMIDGAVKGIKIKNFKYNDPMGLLTIIYQVTFEKSFVTVNCIEDEDGLPESKNSKIITRIAEIKHFSNENAESLYRTLRNCLRDISWGRGRTSDQAILNKIDGLGFTVLDYIKVSNPRDRYDADKVYVFCQKPIKEFDRNNSYKCDLGKGKSLIEIEER